MVEIKVTRRGRHIAFDITGHAHGGAKGEDVICAGVSTLALTLASALAHVGAPGLDATLNSGRAHIACRETKATRPVIQTVMRGFDIIADSYPANVGITMV